ncbi:haloacid dehalogenase type II [Loktanella salsilacus]|jgi:2-haloacid dehalogenase|uniref:haloacid dehalogenase type II n=1 Tax=Loktanella salsilacus TaxID=195913 RepID=UPI0020B66AA3|nr:haloacid dehalogenase type II [Loktanella salsilacus]UTH48916.1 haloacid dehalogenase type II [Loktanella salsilacus]|tara:strand:+ start:2982 stop:3659 length:678 start_codon:yes stop_codon:yes gene_type:complete
MTITTCIFDAYGTLFDVNAAARRAAQEPGQERLAAVWEQLARDWRQKQLEYSWLRAVADRHCDFWQLTQDGLDWAMEAAGLDDPALRKRLLALYWELEAYPEVPAMLRTLKDRGMTTAILSNGPPDMLRAAITLAGLNDLLDDALSVEDVGVFKPHVSVYDMVGNRFGCRRDQVMFVSSNGWDAAAGAGYGFHTAWVNRLGAPIDRLYAQPQHVLPDLSTLPEYV